jgi:hypothetical protein
MFVKLLRGIMSCRYVACECYVCELYVYDPMVSNIDRSVLTKEYGLTKMVCSFEVKSMHSYHKCSTVIHIVANGIVLHSVKGRKARKLFRAEKARQNKILFANKHKAPEGCGAEPRSVHISAIEYGKD